MTERGKKREELYGEMVDEEIRGVQVSKEIIVFYEFEIKTRGERIRRPLSRVPPPLPPCRRRSEGQRG